MIIALGFVAEEKVCRMHGNLYRVSAANRLSENRDTETKLRQLLPLLLDSFCLQILCSAILVPTLQL